MSFGPFAFGLFGVDLVAERFEIGDVGFVVVRDVRNLQPVAMQVRTGELLDARQRLALDLTELREIDLRPRRQADGERCAPARRLAALQARL